MEPTTLSPRQRKIVELVALGYQNRAIALEMSTSEQAVKSALHSVFDKLGVWNRVELVRWHAQHNGSFDHKGSENKIEAARIGALHELKVLDTPPEPAFDDLIRIASHICDTPIALLTLLDSDRQWFKARMGMPMSQTPRNISFCNHAVQGSAPLLVQDALQDERFRQSPLVLEDPKIRFYAGAPVINSDGYALGSICAIDVKPRSLSAPQLDALSALGRVTARLLECYPSCPPHQTWVSTDAAE